MVKSFAKKLITLSLLNISLCSVIAFSADGKDHHDPLLFWSWGQSVTVPLPSIEPSQVNPAVREAMRRLAERLREEHGQQVSTSSSSSASKRTWEKGEDTGETEERAAKTQRTGLTEEELLKNELVISVAEFNEDNLISRAEELKNIGVLAITPEPGVKVDLVNLLKLIENYFPNVLSLQLDEIRLGDVGFGLLAKSAIAAQLKELEVGHCGITAQSLAMENLGKFKSLEVLDIHGNSIENVGFKLLAESNLAAQLKELIIKFCGVTVQSFTVENLNEFKSLEWLSVDGNPITDAGFKALAKSDLAAQLRKLSIVQCGVTAQSFTVESLNEFKALEWLRVVNSQLGDIGFAALATSNIAAQLKRVGLMACGITAQSFTIENLNRFKSLEVFGISYNQIGDVGFKAIAESDIATQLKELIAQFCGITAQSFTVETLNRFKNLEKLLIYGNRLSEKALEVLKQSRLIQTLKEISAKSTGLPEGILKQELQAHLRSSVSSSSPLDVVFGSLKRWMKKTRLPEEELLKKKMVLPLAKFTEDNLKIKPELLKEVGTLIIEPSPGVGLSAINLIKLIEKYFPNILNLQLDELELGDAGFSALAKSDVAAQLKMLTVARCGITAQSLTAANLNEFKNLELLSLRQNQIGSNGFKALADSNITSQLESLYAQRCGITSRSFTTENINKFKSLKLLALGLNNGIGNDGFRALIVSNIAAQLKTVDMQGNTLSKQLFTSENLNRFKSLEVLLVNMNQIGNGGFRALAKSNIASQLKELRVAGCGITERSFTVENLNRFKNLIVFDISANTLGSSAFLALMNSNLSRTLQVLMVQGTGLRADTLNLLKERTGIFSFKPR